MSVNAHSCLVRRNLAFFTQNTFKVYSYGYSHLIPNNSVHLQIKCKQTLKNAVNQAIKSKVPDQTKCGQRRKKRRKRWHREKRESGERGKPEEDSEGKKGKIQGKGGEKKGKRNSGRGLEPNFNFRFGGIETTVHMG